MTLHPSFRFEGPELPPADAQSVLLDRLNTIAIEGDFATEIRSCLEADVDRFLYTLVLTSNSDSSRALEIGANSHFASIPFHERRARVLSSAA